MGSLIRHLVIKWAGQGNSTFPCHSTDGTHSSEWQPSSAIFIWVCNHTHPCRCQQVYPCWHVWPQVWLSSPVSPSICLQVTHQILNPGCIYCCWLLCPYNISPLTSDRQKDRLNDTWIDPWKSPRAAAVSLIRYTHSPCSHLHTHTGRVTLNWPGTILPSNHVESYGETKNLHLRHAVTSHTISILLNQTLPLLEHFGRRTIRPEVTRVRNSLVPAIMLCMSNHEILPQWEPLQLSNCAFCS